jgi:hypothetical protein
VKAKESKRPHQASRGLPDDFEALLVLSQCFGLGEKDFLERYPHEIPLNISRQKLLRARSGEGIAEDERERLRTRIYARLYHAPFAGCAGRVSPIRSVVHALTTEPLRLYRELLPRLNNNGRGRREGLWILFRHVFLPTVVQLLRTNSRCGLGTEFRGEHCWYLPRTEEGKAETPIQRVLDCWLRCAGYRTAYGVAQARVSSRTHVSATGVEEEKQWQRERKNINRWLKGSAIPTPATLHRLVDIFEKRTEWLDTADSWKVRFTLACAAQKLWEMGDNYFHGLDPDPALTLAAEFAGLFKQAVPYDDQGLLADPSLFFAVRLLFIRLEREGVMEGIIRDAREPRSARFGPEVPDKEIIAWQTKAAHEANPGNAIVRHVRELMARRRRTALDVRAFIFDLGVDELNRLLAEAKGRQEPHPAGVN